MKDQILPMQCACFGTEHLVLWDVVVLPERAGGEVTLFLHQQLNVWKPWYARVLDAIRYLFGGAVSYPYDVTLVAQRQDAVMGLLKEYINACEAHFDFN